MSHPILSAPHSIAMKISRPRNNVTCLCAVFLGVASFLSAQVPAAPATRQQHVGDAPAAALPLASDLSGKLTHRDVRRAIHKVADWQLHRAQPDFDQDWTYAALYAGFMAVPDGAGGKQYRDAMQQMGAKFNWQPGPRLAH